MRPKPTYSDARGSLRLHESQKGSLVGDHAKPSDKKIDRVLAEILQTWRGLENDLSLIPPLADVRATLEKLSSMDDVQRKKALPFIDSTTEVELEIGALRWYRRSSPTGPLPNNLFNFLWHQHSDQNEMIRLAIDHLNSMKPNGRRSNKVRNVKFALQLVNYCRARENQPLSISLNHDKPSPFLFFAHNCFHSVGLKLSYGALRPILRAALKCHPTR